MHNHSMLVVGGIEARIANTNVLRTEVRCPGGRFEIFDYAPRVPPVRAQTRHWRSIWI